MWKLQKFSLTHWGNWRISLSQFLRNLWIFFVKSKPWKIYLVKIAKTLLQKCNFSLFRAFLRRSEIKVICSLENKVQNNHLHTWPASCRLGAIVTAKWPYWLPISHNLPNNSKISNVIIYYKNLIFISCLPKVSHDSS